MEKRATSLRTKLEKSYGFPSTVSRTLLALPITNESGPAAEISLDVLFSVSDTTVSRRLRISVHERPFTVSEIRRCPGVSTMLLAGVAAAGDVGVALAVTVGEAPEGVDEVTATTFGVLFACALTEFCVSVEVTEFGDVAGSKPGFEVIRGDAESPEVPVAVCA